jgi:hypothetical protein
MQCTLSKIAIISISIKVFEKLDWDLIFQDENIAEAKRKNEWGTWTEKITIACDFGAVKIKSESLGNENWDNGRNSKRVKLFIHAFRETEKEFGPEALVELENEVRRINSMADYVVPESLPQPVKKREPALWLVISGGLITALILGYLLAYPSSYGFYIIGLFELLIAIAVGFILKHLIKLSNYTKLDHLHYVLIGMVLVIYIFNQYFQYQIFLKENNSSSIGFLTFIELRLKAGLTIKDLNTGSIGLIVSWILQLGLTYLIGLLRLGRGLIGYQIERVPTEVIDFATYHFVQKKTEDQVRLELKKMGWKDKEMQDEVMEAIGALQGATALNRA